MQDPVKALGQVERILAKEPHNASALQLATLVACDVTYRLQLHGGTAAEIAAAEATARAYAGKLTPRARWLVWSECNRWSGIWLEGDIDKLGDGTKLEHIGPKKP